MVRAEAVGMIAVLVGTLISPGAALARSITVSGQADTLAVPDQAVWVVNIADRGQDLGEVKEANDAKFAAILGAAEKIAAVRDDRSLGGIRVDRVYDRDEWGRAREFSHFEVSRTLRLRQRDLSKFEEALSLLIGAADVEVHFQYEVSGAPEIMDRLRLQAFDAARRKAAALAQRAGLGLGAVMEISEFPPAQESRGFSMELPAPPVWDVGSPQARSLAARVYVQFELR